MRRNGEQVPDKLNPGLSYERAREIIAEYGSGAIWIDHCTAVSRLAAQFGEIFSSRYDLDLEFLRTSALLHDIGRYRTHDPIRHGVEGYHLLISLGFPREASVCASHVLFGIQRETASHYGLPARDFIPETLEEQLIPVVDSLVEFDRPTTIEMRLASIRRRYRDNDHFLALIEIAAAKTRKFVKRMDQEFGISMERIASETLSRED